MPYFEKHIISGDLLEVERYSTHDANRSAPREKDRVYSRDKELLNTRAAQRRIIRLINANFSGEHGDLFVTLTYARAVDEETAKREVRNFIRRIRHHMKRNGLPALKHINITERQSRWHHHLIMNKLPCEVITDLWGRGRVTISKLDKTHSYEDLAKYLISDEKSHRQEVEIGNTKAPRKKYARRWNSSMNLVKPVVTIQRISRRHITKASPAAPPGYRLAGGWQSGADAQGNLYQYYRCIKMEV